MSALRKELPKGALDLLEPSNQQAEVVGFRLGTIQLFSQLSIARAPIM
jgi:hypothetical protein